ncbi:hypothetical protein Ahy_B04g071324 isoform C [Arachis hypogaea]|uniref:Uncharacterized protein n=1 Tax=Arachis hypogaea TaxID=3818 RepID=A0A444ZKG8_ARAHY|nr:hypothetical protein Ahy_B04g071324 isoform C [Arachis hypogaea]
MLSTSLLRNGFKHLKEFLDVSFHAFHAVSYADLDKLNSSVLSYVESDSKLNPVNHHEYMTNKEGCFEVEVQPNVDYGFVVALLTIVDEIKYIEKKSTKKDEVKGADTIAGAARIAGAALKLGVSLSS